MPNVLPSDPRPPSRVPRRGLAALVLTTTATALLFSFKTPSEMLGSGPGGLTADVTAMAFQPSSNVAVGSGAGSSVSAAPPTLPRTTEPPATLAPATEPPPTEAPPTAEPLPTEAPPTAEPLPTEAPPTAAPATVPPEQVVPGQVVRTRFGLVQVAVTVGPSGITDVQALQLPFDRNYSARISEIVEPMLRDEALQAQSANINLISGATYTSMGYAMSLQSALDQAVASMNAPA